MIRRQSPRIVGSSAFCPQPSEMFAARCFSHSKDIGERRCRKEEAWQARDTSHIGRQMILPSMRRLFALVMLVALLVALLPVAVSAHTATDLLYAKLIAGQTEYVGHVIIWNDSTNLHVTFQAKFGHLGYCLKETHLHVATSLKDIPQTKKSNPIPGRFDYKDDDLGCIHDSSSRRTQWWATGSTPTGKRRAGASSAAKSPSSLSGAGIGRPTSPTRFSRSIRQQTRRQSRPVGLRRAFFTFGSHGI